MKKEIFQLSAILLLCVAGNAWGQAQYTVTDLGTLGGTSSCAYGINNSGQVVGQAATSSGAEHAFLYSGGTMTDLGTLGGSNSCATGINNLGQVVGNADTGGLSPPPLPQPYSHAFLYSGGTMQDLGTLPGGFGSGAYGINDSGQIVGGANTSYSFPFWGHAFLYSGTMQDLGTFGAQYSAASGINASGQVVGSYGDFIYSTGSANVSVAGPHAFLYSDGTMQDLGTLPGAAFSTASGINNSGQVAGYSDYENTSPNHYRAFLYDDGSMVSLGTLGGQNSWASGLNDDSEVVGCANTGNGNIHAFLYGNGVMTDLNSLIPAGSGWTLTDANAINDNGQIVGYGTNPSGQTDAFLLTPTPEPSTLALLGAGAIGLLGFAWRRPGKDGRR
jgi:probable HAF family extracellular repeat protein